MKKRLFTTLIIIFSVTLSLNAQSQGRDLSIRDQRVERVGEQVVVSFRANVDKKVAKNGETVIYSPMITDGVNQWSLPSIVVRGRRAEKAMRRSEWISGAKVFKNDSYENKIIFTSNGSSFGYRAVVDWQNWMNGADLVMERMDMGCCNAIEYGDMVLLTSVLGAPSPRVVVPEQVVERVEQPQQQYNVPIRESVQSTGDRLTEVYSFVRSAGEFKGMIPGEMERDREQSLMVNFRQGKYDIDPYLSDNYRTLGAIIESVRTLQTSPDSRVSHIVIAGFASPEGSYDFNNQLAYNRATAVKRYISERTGLREDNIMIYNGGEDWYGLREMVERSDIYEKGQILYIIDNYPTWGYSYQLDRENELKRLNGGRTYQYLYKYIYPRLRNAAYIKVYYENK